MRISIAFAEKKFDEFNRLIFGGRLPRVAIELCAVKSFFGDCVCRKRRVALGLVECYDYRLRFNIRADLPERDLEDVIIHEMIHYYIGVNNLRDTSAHGPLFRSLMNKINERFGRHVTVSRKIAEADKEQFLQAKREWRIVVLLSFENGKTGVKVLPRVLQSILNYYNMGHKNAKIREMKFFMSDDVYFGKFPKSSAFNCCFADRGEVMEHLAGATPVVCDGRSVVLNGRRYVVR